MNILDKSKLRAQCFIYYIFILHILLLRMSYINNCKLIREFADKYCSANPFIFNKNIKNHAKNKVS